MDFFRFEAEDSGLAEWSVRSFGLIARLNEPGGCPISYIGR